MKPFGGKNGSLLYMGEEFAEGSQKQNWGTSFVLCKAVLFLPLKAGIKYKSTVYTNVALEKHDFVVFICRMFCTRQ